MTAVTTWDDFPGPRHEDEIMASHQLIWPSTAVQNRTHGAPAPEPDHGEDDRVKYGSPSFAR